MLGEETKYRLACIFSLKERIGSILLFNFLYPNYTNRKGITAGNSCAPEKVDFDFAILRTENYFIKTRAILDSLVSNAYKGEF